MTLACVADTSFTFVTFADACDARPEPAWELMIEANCDPSCSRLTRLGTGVFASKKAVQFVATASLAAAPAAAAVEADGEGDAAEADGAGVLAGEAGLPAVLLGPLLPQAARPAPSAQASRTGASNL